MEKKYLVKFINCNVGDGETVIFECDDLDEIYSVANFYIEGTENCLNDYKSIYENDCLIKVRNELSIQDIESMILDPKKSITIFKDEDNYDCCIYCYIEIV